MSKELESLEKQIADLEAKRAEIIERERGGALKQAKELIAKFGFSAVELGIKGTSRTNATAKPRKSSEEIIAKAHAAGKKVYRSPDGAHVYVEGSRGREPAWFSAEQNKAKLLIK